MVGRKEDSHPSQDEENEKGKRWTKGIKDISSLTQNE